MCEEIEELARLAGLKNNNKNNEARDKEKNIEKHLRVGFIAMSDKKTEIAWRLSEELSYHFVLGTGVRREEKFGKGNGEELTEQKPI